MTVQKCPFDHFMNFPILSFIGLHESLEFTGILNYNRYLLQCFTAKYESMIIYLRKIEIKSTVIFYEYFFLGI
jgi:hypothetical protein